MDSVASILEQQLLALVVQWGGVLVPGVQVAWTPFTCLSPSLIHSANYCGVCLCVDSLWSENPLFYFSYA